MEKHVTSLELSKRLKALGVKQESEFYWTPYITDIGGREVVKYQIGTSPIRKTGVFAQPFYDDVDNYSAYLASEIGEMLPIEAIDSEVINFFPTQLTIEKNDAGWYVYYKNTSEIGYSGDIDNDENIEHGNLDACYNMADAMALMLEYLIQNKMI